MVELEKQGRLDVEIARFMGVETDGLQDGFISESVSDSDSSKTDVHHEKMDC
jgi:hypothetical protein